MDEIAWRKSSYSGAGNCVQVGTWTTSSYSGYNGDCLQGTLLAGNIVGVRDSKDPAGPVLRFTPAEWAAFLVQVRGVTAG